MTPTAQDARTGSRRSFGSVRKLPSGRFQARYTDPHGIKRRAPETFDRKAAATAWLAQQQADVDRGLWQTPRTDSRTTLGEFAEQWMRHPPRELRPKTAAHYAMLLRVHIVPTLGDVPLAALDRDIVEKWWRALDPAKPTARAHAYRLLHAVLGTAVQRRFLTENPASIEGASTPKRASRIRPATPAELAAVASAMPENLRAIVLLAGWCGLRRGELLELRRDAVDLPFGVVRVDRQVVRVNGTGEFIVGAPKTDAGVRTVAMPATVRDAVAAHLDGHVGPEKTALLFPGADGTSHLTETVLRARFRTAREAAGRPDLRFHDLRHTGATLAARAGATIAELQARIGHSTPRAALIYQHAATQRDTEIAAALDRMMTAQ